MIAKDRSKLATYAHNKGQIFNNSVTVSLSNKATFETVDDTLEFEYSYKPLSKTGNVVDNKYVAYELIINPSGANLSDSETLTLYDVHSDNLSVDFTSLVLINTSTGNQMSKSDYAYNFGYDSSNRYATVFTLPDSVPLKMQYNAYINDKGEQTVTNLAELESYSAGDQKTVSVTSTGKGSGSNPYVTLLKHRYGNANDGLSGAEFKLFIADGNSWNAVKDLKGDNAGKDVVFSTGSDGQVVIEGNQDARGWTLIPERKYALKEIKAPTNYELDPTYYEFTISDRAVYRAPDWKYLNGDIIRVANKRKTTVSVRKEWKNVDGGDIVLPEGMLTVVELYQNGAATGNKITLDGVKDTGDITTGEIEPWVATFGFLDYNDSEGNEYQYTVKETNVPAGFTVSYGVDAQNSELEAASNNGIITNTKVPSIGIQLSGTKFLDGHAASAGQFYFTVEKDNTMPAETAAKVSLPTAVITK